MFDWNALYGPIPDSFKECLSYEQQILFLANWIEKVEEEATGGVDLTELKERVTACEQNIILLQRNKASQASLDSVAQDVEAVETEIASIRQALTLVQSAVANKLDTATFDSFEDEINSELAGIDATLDSLGDNIVELQEGKQKKLVAGTNITLTDEGTQVRISSSGGGGGTVDVDSTVTENSPNPVASSGIYSFVNEKVAGKADASDLTALAGRVSTNETDIDNLETSVNGKADASSVTALAGRVSTNETDIDNLETAVAGKANAGYVAALAEWASSAETDISDLQTAVAGKADTSSVSALATRVSTAESDIDNLETSVNGKADASSVTTLAGRVTTAEGDIDNLETAVAGKQKQLVAGSNITLTDEGTQVRISSSGGGGSVTVDSEVTENSSNPVASSGIYSFVNTKVAGKADASDLTALAGRVTTAEGDIDNLETAVAGKASQTALNNLSAVVNTKQKQLVQGQGISIDDYGSYAEISATGGGGGGGGMDGSSVRYTHDSYTDEWTTIQNDPISELKVLAPFTEDQADPYYDQDREYPNAVDLVMSTARFDQWATEALSKYQPLLTAGSGITIDPNTNEISATGGGSGSGTELWYKDYSTETGHNTLASVQVFNFWQGYRSKTAVVAPTLETLPHNGDALNLPVDSLIYYSNGYNPNQVVSARLVAIQYNTLNNFIAALVREVEALKTRVAALENA